MKLLSTTALGLALALAPVVLIGIQPADAKKAAEAAKPKYTAAIQTNVPVAQKALDAGDFAAAKTAIAAAEAGMQTSDDKYAVGQMKLQLGIKTQDQALQGDGIDMLVASGAASPADLPKILNNQAVFAIQARNYAKADAALTQSVQLTPSDADNIAELAEVKNMEGKPTEALPLLDQAIAAKKQAGQVPTEDWYKRSLAIAVNTKSIAAIGKYGMALVQAYPTPTNWRDSLLLYRDNANPDTQAELDIFRLMRVAKALNGERDFYDYANSAFDKGLPGEAAAVIGEGTAANMVGGASRALTEVKTLSTAKIAADRASLAGGATRAQSAATGKPAASTADAYLGYGDYAKAAALYQLALQKGGVDADTVNTRLGIALARSGQKAAAVQAFGAVTGPIRKPIADYWTVWTNAQA